MFIKTHMLKPYVKDGIIPEWGWGPTALQLQDNTSVVLQIPLPGLVQTHTYIRNSFTLDVINMVLFKQTKQKSVSVEEVQFLWQGNSERSSYGTSIWSAEGMISSTFLHNIYYVCNITGVGVKLLFNWQLIDWSLHNIYVSLHLTLEYF